MSTANHIIQLIDYSLCLKGGPGSGHWRHTGRKGKRGGSLPSKGGAVRVVNRDKLTDLTRRELNTALDALPSDVKGNIDRIIVVDKVSDLKLSPEDVGKVAHTYPNYELVGGLADLRSEYTGSTIEVVGNLLDRRTIWHEVGHIHHHAKGMVVGEFPGFTRQVAEEYANTYSKWVQGGKAGDFLPPTFRLTFGERTRLMRERKWR